MNQSKWLGTLHRGLKTRVCGHLIILASTLFFFISLYGFRSIIKRLSALSVLLLEFLLHLVLTTAAFRFGVCAYDFGGFEGFVVLDFLGEIHLESSWCLFDNGFLHFHDSLGLNMVSLLGVVYNFGESPEGSIWALTFVIFLFGGPLEERHPTVLELRVTAFSSRLPVTRMVNFVRDEEFRLLWLVNSFKWIDRSDFACSVCQFHLIIVGPVLGLLFKQVETLASW